MRFIFKHNLTQAENVSDPENNDRQMYGLIRNVRTKEGTLAEGFVWYAKVFSVTQRQISFAIKAAAQACNNQGIGGWDGTPQIYMDWNEAAIINKEVRDQTFDARTNSYASWPIVRFGFIPQEGYARVFLSKKYVKDFETWKVDFVEIVGLMEGELRKKSDNFDFKNLYKTKWMEWDEQRQQFLQGAPFQQMRQIANAPEHFCKIYPWRFKFILVDDEAPGNEPNLEAWKEAARSYAEALQHNALRENRMRTKIDDDDE